jgi:aspartate racemase
MRSIGLLGGTSWPSTIAYYRLLNGMIQQRLGGFHSAELILLSLDFHDIKSRFHHAWAEIPGLLLIQLERLFRLGPDCMLICNNTLHKALDLLGEATRPPVRIFHLIELTAAHAFERGLRRALLLGTRFTMEDG